MTPQIRDILREILASIDQEAEDSRLSYSVLQVDKEVLEEIRFLVDIEGESLDE